MILPSVLVRISRVLYHVLTHHLITEYFVRIVSLFHAMRFRRK